MINIEGNSNPYPIIRSCFINVPSFAIKESGRKK